MPNAQKQETNFYQHFFLIRLLAERINVYRWHQRSEERGDTYEFMGTSTKDIGISVYRLT